MHAQTKHAKPKPKMIERWTQDPIEKRWAMNAISRQAENAVPEANEETSDERRRYSDHTAQYTTINQKQRFRTAAIASDCAVPNTENVQRYQSQLGGFIHLQ